MRGFSMMGRRDRKRCSAQKWHACRSTSTFAFDEERIGAVLRRVGFTNFQPFETGSTHCLLAQDVRGLSVIAFRGTDADDPTDLGLDLLLSPWRQGGKIHQGLQMLSVRLDVENTPPHRG